MGVVKVVLSQAVYQIEFAADDGEGREYVMGSRNFTTI